MNWIDLTTGFAIGGATGALFFLGLGLGINFALKTANAGQVLFLSTALRISLLMLAGWLVAQSGSVSLMGFAIAFVLARFIAVMLARAPLDREVS